MLWPHPANGCESEGGPAVRNAETNTLLSGGDRKNLLFLDFYPLLAGQGTLYLFSARRYSRCAKRHLEKRDKDLTSWAFWTGKLPTCLLEWPFIAFLRCASLGTEGGREMIDSIELRRSNCITVDGNSEWQMIDEHVEREQRWGFWLQLIARPCRAASIADGDYCSPSSPSFWSTGALSIGMASFRFTTKWLPTFGTGFMFSSGPSACMPGIFCI